MFGYSGLLAEVDLTRRSVDFLELPEPVLRDYLGGTGIGSRLLYDRVSPGVQWNDPANCVVLASGPLGATRAAGSGAFSAVTKGAMTNGATSTQANGFFGAYLETSGLDGLVISGAADEWVFLHVHDGAVDVRDASQFVGLDTRTTEAEVKKAIGCPGHKSSVFSIGPAGENLVRFAAIVGDEGHVAAHNGIGAVWGSKKLKAIAVERGSNPAKLYRPERVRELAREMIEQTRKDPAEGVTYERGTSHLLEIYRHTGVLPAKNLTTNVIGEEYDRLGGSYYRERFELRRTPCWGCPSRHCNQIRVTEGPYTGVTGEEPDYELFALFGPGIGQSDPGAAVMLANLCDKLGVDGNEAGWLAAFAIDCFEHGVLTTADTGGLELRWGNVEAVRALLVEIASRRGIGEVLAEGVMRAAQALGGEALELGVYVEKGHAPRGHDHRARWLEMFDTATSNTGTIESMNLRLSDPFSPAAIAEALVKGKLRNFVDSLVICAFTSRTMISTEIGHLVDLINAATGWDYSSDEAVAMSLRAVNLMRAFNVRHGITPEVERPSKRYASPPVDGPYKGVDVGKVWDETVSRYYDLMGWNRDTGKPRPEVLRDLGLEEVVRDLYPTSAGMSGHA